MRRYPSFYVLFTGLLLAGLLLAGCSREKKVDAQVYGPGEKAQVGSLSYSLIDSEVVQQLGENPATARTPQNRFILVQISVLNSGGEETSIPSLSLVDDAGQIYNELPDGTGVEHWMGMVRKVGGTQTETGTIIFDAPAKHYRLRLTDEFAPGEISIDMPLNFIHEQMQHIAPPASDLPSDTTPDTVAAPPVKK